MTKKESVDAASMHPIVHTPWPWKVAKNGRSVVMEGIRVNQVHGPGAASCTAEARFDEVLRQNAILISLAPEMVYCLRRLLPFVNDYNFRCSPEGKVLSDRINALLEKVA
jgi:hypothetical protein